MIQVIIAEDHAIVREGIRALLEKSGEIQIVGEGKDGFEAFELAKKFNPDVIIMDIMMPLLNGIQAADKIHKLKLAGRVVLLSMYSDESLVYQALQCGVKGYVLKSSVSEELLRAVHAAARGEIYMSHQISDIMVNTLLNPHTAGNTEDPAATLSPREKEILKLIAEEHTSGEIAEILFISEKTVEKHRASLMAKLHVRNLAGLARIAVKIGLVDRE